MHAFKIFQRTQPKITLFSSNILELQETQNMEIWWQASTHTNSWTRQGELIFGIDLKSYELVLMQYKLLSAKLEYDTSLLVMYQINWFWMWKCQICIFYYFPHKMIIVSSG